MIYKTRGLRIKQETEVKKRLNNKFKSSVHHAPKFTWNPEKY